MNAIAKISIVFIGIAIGAGIFSFVIMNESRKLENKYQVKINNQVIIAEMVKTEKDREKGLSGRDSIGINEGMLFQFPGHEMASFWMKGMKFPIDIIWINDGVVVGFEENVVPKPGVIDEELSRYTSPSPINQVLEIQAGRAKQLKLFIGAHVVAKPIIQ